MAEREMRWGRLAGRDLDYVVRRLTDRDQIRGLLLPSIEYTAYALGQLEPGLFERARWYAAHGDTGRGIVLHSRGGLGEATVSMGDADAVAAILSIHPGPVQTYATCQPHHLEVMRDVYRLSNPQPMIRMLVTPGTFQPAPLYPAIALSGIDIRRLNGLYATEGAPSYYIADHIDNGLYRGIMVDGRLVAVAGTHVVARHEGVAVVGNVFTHPAYRGRGYATAATSAVTQELLGFCTSAVLTVDPKNAAAVAAYRRLGYAEGCQLIEASAARRDPSGLASTLRRFRAALRGRKYDGSFVSLRGR